MSTAATFYEGDARHPFGLPQGAVRGFFALLICAFYWVVLLLPDSRSFLPPLGHYVLLGLVAGAFVAPHRHGETDSTSVFWLLLILGVTVAVTALVMAKFPGRFEERITFIRYDKQELAQLPLLIGTAVGGYGVGLLLRLGLGRTSNLFQSLRAWIGVIAGLLLVAETVFQFLIRPAMSTPPSPDMLRVWEAILVGPVAAYFGSRAV